MIVYGRNTVIEALKSSHNSKEVFLEEGINPDAKISEIIELAENSGVKLKYTPKKNLFKISKTQDHQGVILDIEFRLQKLKEVLQAENTFSNSFIYISESTYEHNVGAIIRTAECAGLAGVIIPTDINITPVIAKVSSGSVFHIPIISLSIFQAIKELKDNSYDIVGIERNGNSYYTENISDLCLFIIGGEDKSLTENIRSHCNKIVEIPQFGKVNSLNMSVATSIIIYEHIRQKLA